MFMTPEEVIPSIHFNVSVFQLAKLDEIDGTRVVLPCTLDKETQSLVKLIFDHDMFKEAMANLEIGQLLS